MPKLNCCARGQGSNQIAFAFTTLWTAAVLSGCGARDHRLIRTESSITAAGGISLNEDRAHGLPGCYRCSIAAADFDGDGKLDLVMAGAFDAAFTPGMRNYRPNSIRLFRNVSARGDRIQFAFVQELAGVSGLGGALVVIGDFDGDGRPDFAVQFRNGDSPASDTSAFLNRGSFQFGRSVVARGFSTHSTSLGMAAADMDQDGRTDLVFASDGAGSAPGLWYRFDPARSHWQAMQSGFAHRLGYGGAVAAGDLDGDGFPELIVTGSSSGPFGAYDCSSSTRLYGQIHANLGQPAGIDPTPEVVLTDFALQAPSNPMRCAGISNAGIAIADVDRDGHADILFAGEAPGFRGPDGMNVRDAVFVVLRNTAGSGREFIPFEHAPQPNAQNMVIGGSRTLDFPNITVGDLNGDGYPEVFLQGRHRGDRGAEVMHSRMFLNEGGTWFSEVDAVLPSAGEGGQVMADFNGDGLIDLIYTGASFPYAFPDDPNTAANLAAHVFRNTAGRGSPPDAGTPDSGRADGGPLDSGSRPADAAPRDGGPLDSGSRPADAAPRDAGPADMGSALRDAGMMDRDAQPPDAPSSTSDAGQRDSGSLRPDAGPIGSGSIRLSLESNPGIPGCYRCQVAVADFDGDGYLDVVMAGAFDRAFTPGMRDYTYQNLVRVYRNVSTAGGAIRFELAREIVGVRGGGGALVKIGDFNGDGLPDFAVQFRNGTTPEADTSAFLNQRGFNFARSIVARGFSTRSTSLGMESIDIDRDGRDDLIFNSDGYGAGPGLWYRYNPGTSTWEARQTDFRHRISYGGSISGGDLNGDGYPDIVIGGNSSIPFGAYDCSHTLLYGQIHLNAGRGGPGIRQEALTSLGKFALRSNRSNPPICSGMDNASTLIADVDLDGHNDIILAGSADAFNGPPGLNGSQYDFVVLRNVDGTGNNFVTFENPGVQLPLGETNGGTGNVDSPNIAVGDLDGDRFPEVFLQGHHRDFANDAGRYIFHTRLFRNAGGTTFNELDLGLPNVGEGGQAMADFNNDGKIDLIYTGATIPFHSNGRNAIDYNDVSTLFMGVYRNIR